MVLFFDNPDSTHLLQYLDAVSSSFQMDSGGVRAVAVDVEGDVVDVGVGVSTSIAMLEGRSDPRGGGKAPNGRIPLTTKQNAM